MQNSISAEEVKFIRKKLKQTQAEFAERIGVTRESVIRYEKGGQIPETKNALFKVLLREVTQTDKSKNAVPYFYDLKENIVAEEAPSLVHPDYLMDIPEFAGCTAFRTHSDTMEPKIKSGNILFATRVSHWSRHIEYGQIYNIMCEDGRKYLKYIRRDPKNPDTHFLLQSENEKYDDFSVAKEFILAVWLIHGWLNKQT